MKLDPGETIVYEDPCVIWVHSTHTPTTLQVYDIKSNDYIGKYHVPVQYATTSQISDYVAMLLEDEEMLSQLERCPSLCFPG